MTDENAEISVKIGEREYILRPALAELKSMQAKLGGLINILNKFAEMTITHTQIATVIYYGGRGHPDQTKSMPSIEMIEAMLFEEGVMDVFGPTSRFLHDVMNTGSKNPAVKKAAKMETPKT